MSKNTPAVIEPEHFTPIVEPDTIVDAYDYHRNGVSGEGLDVAIVRHREDGQWNRFLVEFVSTRDDNHGYINGVDIHNGVLAFVLDLDEAAKGNIYMHPEPGKPGTGGNAWRGDRHIDTFLPFIARYAVANRVEREETRAAEARAEAAQRRAAGDEDGANRSEKYATACDSMAKMERDILPLVEAHYAK